MCFNLILGLLLALFHVRYGIGKPLSFIIRSRYGQPGIVNYRKLQRTHLRRSKAAEDLNFLLRLLSDLSLVAQSVLFIIAGYDTTASLLAFSSYLVAKHEDQQRRLRDEVRQIVAEHGDLTYQGIMEAKLLDGCLLETLRLYPPATMLERSCSKTYKLPGTDLTLKPGDLVQVPVFAIHHDSNLWPDPEAFIPDRFLPENKANIHPFSHMPFGMGPRNCIAMRFALLEAKVALAKLLLEAELKLAPGHEDLVVISEGGLLRPKGGVKLLLKPLEEEYITKGESCETTI